MTPSQYNVLHAHARYLLRKYHVRGDEFEIVVGAFLLSPEPTKNHIRTSFLNRYPNAVENLRLEVLSRGEKTRTCNRCNTDLPIGAFTRESGTRRTCDNCMAARSREWNERNMERRRAIGRKHYHASKI